MDLRAREITVVDGGQFYRVHVVGKTHLWAEGTSGSEGSTWWMDLASGRQVRVRNVEHASGWPDPLDPERAWLSHPEQLDLIDIASGEVIESRRFAGLGEGRLRVTAVGRQRTAWVATDRALIEVPLDP
jgi:hypothetical protein